MVASKYGPRQIVKTLITGMTLISLTFLLGIVFAFLLTYRFDLPAGAGVVTTLTSSFFLVLGVTLLLERKKKVSPEPLPLGVEK